MYRGWKSEPSKKSNRAIDRLARRESAVVRKRQTGDTLTMVLQGRYLLAGLNIPHKYLSFNGTHGQKVVVWRASNCAYLSLVSRHDVPLEAELLEEEPSIHLPYPNVYTWLNLPSSFRSLSFNSFL